jgi:para-nitrobenzyl esterase
MPNTNTDVIGRVQHLLGWSRAMLCLVVLLALGFSTVSFAAVPTITLEQGTLSGVEIGEVTAFLGVRYAMAPVGDLRWRPPQPVGRSSQPVDASKFGNNCPQGTSPWGTPSSTEDCLFLNIYLPPGKATSHRGDQASKLPVMVWLHGGGFSSGQGSAYDPTPLVRENVVVVTINYRLGALGLFAHPALDSEDHLLANYALMDQQLAFNWVKDNIAAFGGDPDNVTIFGESAGGDAVIAHLASPLATGLFQKVIIHSGGTHYISREDSETVGLVLAAKVGCDQGTDHQIAACLRNVPASQLVANEATPIAAIVDGQLLPISPAAAFAKGAFNRVPVINGTNRDEGRIVVALFYDLATGPLQASGYQTALEFFGSFLPGTGYATTDIPAIMKEYSLDKYPSPDLATAQVITDGTLACPALDVDQALSRYVPVWAYEFSDQNAPVIVVPPASFPYGATHFSELQFLFNMSALTLPGTPSLSQAEQDLSTRMVRYWTAFATFSDPNSVKHVPYWRPFNHVTGRPMQSLETPRPRAEVDFYRDHDCAFWHALAP